MPYRAIKFSHAGNGGSIAADAQHFVAEIGYIGRFGVSYERIGISSNYSPNSDTSILN